MCENTETARWRFSLKTILAWVFMISLTLAFFVQPKDLILLIGPMRSGSIRAGPATTQTLQVESIRSRPCGKIVIVYTSPEIDLDVAVTEYETIRDEAGTTALTEGRAIGELKSGSHSFGVARNRKLRILIQLGANEIQIIDHSTDHRIAMIPLDAIADHSTVTVATNNPAAVLGQNSSTRMQLATIVYNTMSNPEREKSIVVEILAKRE